MNPNEAAAIRHALAELRAAVSQTVRAIDAIDAALPANPIDGQLLLRAIVRAVGSAVFSTRELRSHARLHLELHAAIGPVSAKQLGKRLHAIANTEPAGPMRLVRIPRNRDGCMWQATYTEPADSDRDAGG